MSGPLRFTSTMGGDDGQYARKRGSSSVPVSWSIQPGIRPAHPAGHGPYGGGNAVWYREYEGQGRDRSRFGSEWNHQCRVPGLKDNSTCKMTGAHGGALNKGNAWSTRTSRRSRAVWGR